MFNEIIELIDTLLGDVGHLVYGQMPDYPDDLISVNFSAGNSPTYVIDKLQPMLREPAIQIVTRGLSYPTAIDQLNECINILHEYVGPLGSSKHHVISTLTSSDVMALGRDDRNRYLFSINMIMKIQ